MFIYLCDIDVTETSFTIKFEFSDDGFMPQALFFTYFPIQWLGKATSRRYLNKSYTYFQSIHTLFLSRMKSE